MIDQALSVCNNKKVNNDTKHSSTVAIFSVITGIFLFLGGFIIGEHKASISIPVSNAESISASSTVDFTPFWKAWNVLEEKFVAGEEAPTNQEKVWGAIEGLASVYGDPYTTFFPPEEAKNFAEEISGSFEGVGMELGVKDGMLTVISPLKGNPAERAGVKAGDVIISIDGKSAKSVNTESAVKLIRGPKGTPVTITVMREGVLEPIEIKIIRDTINMPTVETEITPEKVFVIRIYSFSAQSANLFRSALREFVGSGSYKLVVDVRNNPGGYLESAVDMASWFLPLGKSVVIEDFGTSTDSSTNLEPKVYRSRGYNIFNQNLKMAVLVNGGSASASEILAGALQDYGIATIVGEKTFGKGSVQELVPITKDTSLKVTVARWVTPKGQSISKVGLTPDVEVKQTVSDTKAKIDTQLQKAIEILGQK